MQTGLATATSQRRRAVDTGPKNLEQTRYVFFPGNLVDPNRARELSDLLRYRVGGAEVDSPCLRAIDGWDNFVGRCRITPVLVYGQPLPRQMMAEGERAVILDRSPVPQVADDGVGFGGNMGPQQASYGVRAFPGEHIDFITDRNSQVRRGVTELRSLFQAGMEWEDFAASGIQERFFPNLLALPKTLREIEEMIAAVPEGGDRLIASLKAEMLGACHVFRLWATRHLDERDALVQKGTNDAGFADRYTPLDLLLLEQMERERLDAYAKAQAKTAGTMTNVMQQLADVQREQMESNRRMQELMIQNQQAINERLTAVYPAPTEPTAPKGNNPKPANK